MTNIKTVTLPVLDRYEMKFVIPEYLIDEISDFISPYCSLDRYSKDSEDTYYSVNNLYFDSPYFLFLRNRMIGCGNRFNLRVRSYSNAPQLPYFLEIKQKKINIVRKFRGRVYERNWYEMLVDWDFQSKHQPNTGEKKNIELFQKLAHIYNAEPKVLTQYRRKAFVSDYDEYARVTFDIDLRYMKEDTFNLVPEEKKMISYDISTNYDPECNVILELKCYASFVPLWMVDLIRKFDLKRRSFSKYATGVREVIDCYKLDILDKEPSIPPMHYNNFYRE
ncbi:MAG: polyphosphate polymerase domain-containing protein [Chitinispirillia bacterium]|jgi:SPX domain protein involved in polyphosphate accumulation